MAVTFAEAKEAVRHEVSKTWKGTDPIYIPDWGCESDDFWGVCVGVAQFYVDNDPAYEVIDDRAYLVNKETGDVEVKSVVDNLDWFDEQNFRNYGTIPAFFK
jgi:hypothetical protein